MSKPRKEHVSLAALWASYRQEVLPQGAGEVQIVETRRAFYAGAAGLFYAIMRNLDPDAEPTERDLAMVSDLAQELEASGVEEEAKLATNQPDRNGPDAPAH